MPFKFLASCRSGGTHVIARLSVKNLQCDNATCRFHRPSSPGTEKGPFLASPFSILLSEISPFSSCCLPLSACTSGVRGPGGEDTPGVGAQGMDSPGLICAC